MEGCLRLRAHHVPDSKKLPEKTSLDQGCVTEDQACHHVYSNVDFDVMLAVPSSYLELDSPRFLNLRPDK